MPEQLPPDFAGLPMQDWPNWIYVSLSGRLAYLDETWACYRMHAGGKWTQLNDYTRLQALRMFHALSRNLPPPLAAVAREQLALRHQEAAWLCLQAGRRRAALPHLARSLRLPALRSSSGWLAVEAICGRSVAARAKRLYRRSRGLPAT